MIYRFETLPSTNTYLKELAAQGAPQGTAVLAREQTGGRGRLGRSFHSPAGSGLYLSWLLRPDCPPEELLHLTCAAAVAATQAIEAACGVTAGIKWTNDLVWEGRKLGGILTELGFAEGRVSWAVVGIGINCTQSPEDFPPQLRDMAGSLTLAAGRKTTPEALAGPLLEALEGLPGLLNRRAETLARYRSRCVTLGREISLVRGDAVTHGTALGVDDWGALAVRRADGTLETVQSGEVSVRGMYGYI